MDIVARGFDAGIHFGEYIEKDMIAVRVSPDHRPAIVGSPAYFRSHPAPRSPRDLVQHRCINFRHGSAGLYRWEFEKGKKSLSVAVNGPLIVDDVALVLQAAVDGVGLAYLGEDIAAPHLERGALDSSLVGALPIELEVAQAFPTPIPAADRAGDRLVKHTAVEIAYRRENFSKRQALRQGQGGGTGFRYGHKVSVPAGAAQGESHCPAGRRCFSPAYPTEGRPTSASMQPIARRE
jgi:DNA-binding transcriptional LysR family regulator